MKPPAIAATCIARVQAVAGASLTLIFQTGTILQPMPSFSSPDADTDVFRLIVENAIDLIVRGDAARNRIYVSPSSLEMLGYTPAELLGKHAFELVHPDDLPRVQEVFAKIGPRFPYQSVTFRMRRADANYVWINGRYRHLPADGGILAILRDVTAQKLAEEQLAEANAKLEAANAVLQSWANIDGLTSLANRRRFDELLDDEVHQARRQATSIGLVLLDVDHFKAFNDCYGHLGGDDCLRRVSRCVADALRRPGDHAARYGGEEIAVLLPASDAQGCTKVAERIRAAVTELRIKHDGSRFGVVTVSGGTATMRPSRPDHTCIALIEAADKALYQAKAAGRNCVRPSADELAHVQPC